MDMSRLSTESIKGTSHVLLRWPMIEIASSIVPNLRRQSTHHHEWTSKREPLPPEVQALMIRSCGPRLPNLVPHASRFLPESSTRLLRISLAGRGVCNLERKPMGAAHSVTALRPRPMRRQRPPLQNGAMQGPLPRRDWSLKLDLGLHAETSSTKRGAQLFQLPARGEDGQNRIHYSK